MIAMLVAALVRHGRAALVWAAAVAAFPTIAAQAEPLPGPGGEYRMLRSQTEFGIQLRDGDDVAAADRCARDLGIGEVTRLPWATPRCRFALLHVASADDETAARIREAALTESIHAVYRHTPDGLPHLGTGRVAVKFMDEAAASTRGGIFQAEGVDEIGRIEGVRRGFLAAPAGIEDEFVVAERLRRHPQVEFAEPDLISPLRLAQVTDISNLVADPLVTEQWHLQNSGQGGGIADADINVGEAWLSDVLGGGVTVGMLDDACDLTHEDLAANYTRLSHHAGTGQRSESAALPVAAGQRHGTAMMGLICAESNTRGVVGVAPRSRFTASAGADAGLSASQIAAAFDFALDPNRDGTTTDGVDVHCNSWAGEAGASASSTVVSAIDEAFQEGREGYGMVVVFPAGNDGAEAAEGSSLAAARNAGGQKLTIGVGACNARDRVTAYSNFGAGVDVVAPSNDVFLPQLVTTDNTDDAALGEPGYNSNGVDDFGQPNLSDPRYTRGDSFSAPTESDAFGTSAAAAQVAGVAALVISSAGTTPTATQVRAIIEHTAVQIPESNPDEGSYNVVTGRSLRYGYGRVDAGAAVLAAQNMSSNSPFTWPERVKNVEVDERDDVLTWEKNDDLRTIDGDQVGDETISVLVVQRIGQDFEWAPADGEIYGLTTVVDSAQDVRVVHNSAVDEFEFDDSRGVLYFGIFARNAAGRYSFGVSINSLGEMVETGRISGGGDGNVNDNSGGSDPGAPTVAIQVSPLSGLAPLTVSFRGNAPMSDAPIVGVEWDFGDGSPPEDSAVTSHVYELSGTESETFVATFSVTDSDGDVGRRSVLITVFSSEDVGGGDPTEGRVSIVVRAAGGTSDLGNTAEVGQQLEISVDTSRIVGTPESVFWSLGDGTTRSSFTVLHTYEIAGTFPLSVAVTSRLSSGEAVVFPASRLLTITTPANGNVNLNGNVNDNVPSGGGGGGGFGCGIGMLTPIFAGLALALLRKLRWV